MKRVKNSRWLAIVAVCPLILTAGCATVDELALKFSPGDSTTYRTIIESERNIKWEGSVPDDPVFKGGRNHHKIETTFTQEIQSVDDNGDATAKITFNEIKYSYSTKSGKSFNFDTSNPRDPKHPLAMMIGHSYTIKISPTDQVVKVTDVKDAETEARKGSVVPVDALRLLQPAAIKQRHGTLVLPDTDKSQLRINERWEDEKSFDFGMMGKETYEKIYTLNKIEGQKNRQIAIVKMDGIPSSGTEEPTDLLKDSEIIKDYSGELELDLTTGKVKKYNEKLQEEWTIAFPGGTHEASQESAILTMREVRSYSIEKID